MRFNTLSVQSLRFHSKSDNLERNKNPNLCTAEQQTFDETLRSQPYNKYVGDGSLVTSILMERPLHAARVIMDDHFVTRDRMGRMMTFMARLVADGFSESEDVVRGIGVDEVRALLTHTQTRQPWVS